MRRVVINGKFQGAPQTGVQRVSHALTAEMVKRANGELKGTLDVVVAVPAGVKNIYPNHEHRPILKGAAWEQFELPNIARSDLLLNLSNVAPISRSGDVVMVHDAQAFISPKSYKPLFRYYYQHLQPFISKRASRVLTVSNYAAQCLNESGIADIKKIDVIYNGVDHVHSIQRNNEVIKRLGIEDRPFIAALGSVQHHKNIKTIVNSARHISNRDALLVLIGAATRADYLAAGVEIGENVLLAGRLSDEEMLSVVEHAQAFLFPSLTEGFGLPPLEAMLLGTPAIVAPCGAMPELCTGDALFCEAENVGEWADTINNLLADSALRAHYSKLGIERAKKYTWASAGDKLADVLLRSL